MNFISSKTLLIKEKRNVLFVEASQFDGNRRNFYAKVA